MDYVENMLDSVVFAGFWLVFAGIVDVRLPQSVAHLSVHS